jgi:ankyrin repeat protein
LKLEWDRAVHSGDVDQVRHLIREGVDINSRDRYGQTALMIAARNGQSSLVQFLVDHSADLNHTAKYHLTALMLAVVNGHPEIVRKLVRAGADLEIRGTGAPGFNGKTATDLATAQNRPDLVEALRGAS